MAGLRNPRGYARRRQDPELEQCRLDMWSPARGVNRRQKTCWSMRTPKMKMPARGGRKKTPVEADVSAVTLTNLLWRSKVKVLATLGHQQDSPSARLIPLLRLAFFRFIADFRAGCSGLEKTTAAAR